MLRRAAKTRYTITSYDIDGLRGESPCPSPRHRAARAEMAAEGDAGGELLQQPVRDSGPVLRRDHSRADDAAGGFVVRVPVLAVRDPALRPRLHPHHLEPGATPWPRLR